MILSGLLALVMIFGESEIHGSADVIFVQAVLRWRPPSCRASCRLAF